MRFLGIIGSVAGMVLLIVILVGFNNEEDSVTELPSKQTVKSFNIPDSLFFAGERVPLENFDTRESFDRELNTNAYRHSSTILLIKRSHRYFPIIEPILERIWNT